MKQNELTHESKISDLHLASYLCALDYVVARLENGPAGRMVFVFEGVPHDAIASYYSGTDKVSARKLFGAFRDLKGATAQRF